MPDFTDNLKPSYSGSAILQSERSQSPISVPELSNHLLSRDGFLERQARIVSILEKDPLFSKTHQLNLSRPSRYHLGLARAKALRRLVKTHSWSYEDYKMAEYLVDEMSPFHLHMTMFATTIKEQGSDEQIRELWPKIESWKIIGCYAQTEMGHGSNVRGVECRATYDVGRREFVLNSPTVTSSKWWNGSLGRTANYAIVVAQLCLPKSNSGYKAGGASEFMSYGPHPFIVQIRDLKTHLPLEGIVIGDIGPKYGYPSMDNGYMLFNNFRVPHNALLSRYTKVDTITGAFKKEGHPAVVYGSLTYVRANIVMHARLILARAVTIAVRYTAIRKQFKDRDAVGEVEEMAVLDYPTVQMRILPLLATTFALHYTGEAMYNLYNSTRRAIDKGDFSSIAELHNLSSGLKSLCTTYAANGIETSRRAMGGHGFGGGSGLIGINNDYLSKPTVEGDNYMITQQVASYLIKKMTSAIKNLSRGPEDMTDELFKYYLNNRNTRTPKDIFINGEIDSSAIVDAFRWRAADLSYQAYSARAVKKQKWNNLLIQLHDLSNAYSELILVQNFANAVTSLTSASATTTTNQSSHLSKPTTEILTHLYHLYALHTITTIPLSFLTTSSLTLLTLNQIPNLILELMQKKIRPHAVSLVDSWSIPDYLLNSSLGRYDGRVYEDLFEKAHKGNGVLNEVGFNVDWESEEVVLGSGKGWDGVGIGVGEDGKAKAKL